ncbi:peptidyl-prolyl cis-trans isomerase CYP28, chloroplastic [Andrographis paniculata]|uniref:peptidyl-prolyl cis-trans isomerase CYP28, chloroplastic n=1 Tax=Andrographis paniculata TaxID=175694 RepID=UPI0021E8FAE4|nr:peptidyl-prolyl cis-trans isomerase CYP28, chloroplastic [Andrographis paniculata]
MCGGHGFHVSFIFFIIIFIFFFFLPPPAMMACCASICSSLPNPPLPLNRRSLIFLSTAALPLTPSSSSSTTAAALPAVDTTVTDRVFLDFSVCPSYFVNRTLGQSDLSLCPDSELLGRVVLGLYGNLLPITVSNFKSMCNGSCGSTYKGTLVQKIFPGQFFTAGRQGRRDKGEVKPPAPAQLTRNTETVDSKAFLLEHSRPGLLSLCLSENDDDDDIKLSPDYHNVEFLVTTGPGPCPQLDSRNIVFGSVLQGLDVVTAIASIPTYRPAQRIRDYNNLAQLLGDERAKTARAIWNRPLKTLYISDCGEVELPKSSLSPTLP